MVAWLLAQNHSRNEIAAILGVKVETVTSHIKLIYKATDTSSSHGLLLRLAS
jgi:DNA-binding CsgD family transcriptional regulator